jgi:phage protein D
MATFLGLGSRTIYWDIILEGFNCNEFYGQYVNSMSFKYEIKKIPTATISFVANRAIEELFTPGINIKIDVGYDPIDKVTMIEGKVKKQPAGNAQGSVEYAVEIVDSSINMALTQKNKTYAIIPTKIKVVTEVIGRNGFIPNVLISDGAKPLKSTEYPKQRKMTDLEFLERCAEKWNCVFWVDGKNVYFYDDENAHVAGGTLRKKLPVHDLSPIYNLYYKSIYGTNNVKKITWTQKENKSGSPQAKGANRKGESAEASDYEISYQDRIWVMKPDVIKKMRKNGRNPLSALNKIVGILGSGQLSKAEALLNEYYVPVTHGSDTNKNHNLKPAFAGGNMEFTLELVKGDPYLRAPRIGLLHAGNGITSEHDLPHFMFDESAAEQKYNINKVVTSVNSSGITTQIVATRGRK